ncbi:hypothetical protein ABID65_007707 [Bradyrhizobium sp. S3.9.2]
MNMQHGNFEAEDNRDLYDAGGQPLSDRHAEEQLLGALLLKPQAVDKVVEIVRPADLIDPFNRQILECLFSAHGNGGEVSIDAINAKLGGKDALIGDGLTVGRYVAHLIADADTSNDLYDVADHLQQISERRKTGEAYDIDWRQPFVSRFGGLRWEEIATLGHASGYTWLIEDIFPMGEISLIFGDSGSGKSFGTFDMAMAVARGLKWNGKNTEPGLVIYVAAEAGKGFGKRKLAYSIEHNLPQDADIPFYLCTKRPDFFASDADVLALIEEIITVSKTYSQKLVLIVLDTLSALAPGMNENASQDVSMVRMRLVVLQEKFDAAICLVHHKPKGGATPRGHSSLTADFETTVEFEIVTDKRTPTGGNIHRATVRKQREGKAGLRWEFTLPVVTVGRNKWGNEETSCVVIPFETSQSTARGGYNGSANELLLMHALYDALGDYGVAPPFPLPAAISKVVDVAHIRTAMRAKVVDSDTDEEAADNRFRGAFKRAGDKLRDAGIIGIQKPFWWATGKPVNGMGG